MVQYGPVWSSMALYEPICFQMLLMFAFVQSTQLLHKFWKNLLFFIEIIVSNKYLQLNKKHAGEYKSKSCINNSFNSNNAGGTNFQKLDNLILIYTQQVI